VVAAGLSTDISFAWTATTQPCSKATNWRKLNAFIPRESAKPRLVSFSSVIRPKRVVTGRERAGTRTPTAPHALRMASTQPFKNFIFTCFFHQHGAADTSCGGLVRSVAASTALGCVVFHRQSTGHAPKAL
jgi:hypothetical protein